MTPSDDWLRTLLISIISQIVSLSPFLMKATMARFGSRFLRTLIYQALQSLTISNWWQQPFRMEAQIKIGLWDLVHGTLTDPDVFKLIANFLAASAPSTDSPNRRGF